MTQVPIESVALKLFTGIDNFEIMAIPFFILAGNFLTHGGVARRMINFATSMVGHWYGGLGLAGVMACALFAAVSGSSPATVVAIGSIMLPAMVKQGFPEALRRRRHHHLRRARHPDPAVDRDGDLLRWRPAAASRSIRPASACRRPRSDRLFMAGVIPGIMLATLLGADDVLSRLEERLSAHCRGRAGPSAWRRSAKCIWGLLLILIVLGGIYAGLFTPTEAAAISAVYAFVIAVFVYKDMTLRDVPKVLLGSANMSAMILYIITNAVLFSFLMANENIPQQIAAWITSVGVDWIDVPADRQRAAADRRQCDGGRPRSC